jgi:hypothetical protein
MTNATSYNDIDNLDHDAEIATALGNMVVAWAKAETILCYTFARVFEIHPNRAFDGFYRIPTFEARVKVILGMVPDWQTTQYDKHSIRKLIEKISAQSEARNTWIHGVWCKDKHGDETVIFRFRKPEHSPERKMIIRVQDIKNHTASLRETVTNLAKAVGYLP